MGVDYPDAGDTDGWMAVHPEVWGLIWMLAIRLKTKLNINSAYRSPMKNASLSGSAKHSYHMSGLAIDISLSGGIDPVSLIRNASILGAKGIGYYGNSNFIHVDIGSPSPRFWFGAGSVPSSVKDAISIHMSNSTPNGPFWVDVDGS
jgi:uncharacterized protein YcbK (DUF882 family)